MIGIKIPWQVWACAGVVLFGFTCYHKGAASVQKEWDASVERGKAIVETLKQQQVVVKTKVDTVYRDKVKVIREKGDTIVKQVPVYIPADTPALPGSFRVLHDAAATSTVPAATGSQSAAPVRVTDATATITLNYTQCLVWREEAAAWRQWYTENQTLYEGLRKH